MLKSKTNIELFQRIQSEKLLSKLIDQLNKDFQLSGISKVFDITTIENLNEELTEVVLHLIKFKYDDYLNLIYRIDIPEKELLKISNSNLAEVTEQITFLILKREFQKVWLKQNYK